MTAARNELRPFLEFACWAPAQCQLGLRDSIERIVGEQPVVGERQTASRERGRAC